MTEKKSKVTLIMFSGDLDKALAGFVIATGAAAMGKEVTMFFTFWGLKLLQKGGPTGTSLFGKMLGVMNRGGVDAVGPSRLNMGGLGRWMFKKMMKSKNVTQLGEMRDMALDLGVKMLGCTMSMDVMEISRADMIDGVSDCVGVAAMLEEAAESETTLFI
jgi:peroxiredoxin family protein